MEARTTAQQVSNPPARLKLSAWRETVAHLLMSRHAAQADKPKFPYSPSELRRKWRDIHDGEEPQPKAVFKPSDHPMDSRTPANHGKTRVQYTITGYYTLDQKSYPDLTPDASALEIARAEAKILKGDPWLMLELIDELDGLKVVLEMVPEGCGEPE